MLGVECGVLSTSLKVCIHFVQHNKVTKSIFYDYAFNGTDLCTNSPGHNHFWILDDVTNMGVVMGPRGNSLSSEGFNVLGVKCGVLSTSVRKSL